MSIKLDKIDLRILYELDKECRQPLSSIGKKIRKSPQYVKYRVERLKTEQVIQSVILFTGLPQGTMEAYAFIKLKGSGIVEEKLLIDFLFKMPETYRLYLCDGSYDLAATFLVSDLSRLQEIKETMLGNFPNIANVTFSIAAGSEIYLKKYLHDALDTERIMPTHAVAPSEPVSHAVLRELQRNPFSSLLELSQALKVSYDQVKYLFRNGKPYLGTRLLFSQQTVKRAALLIDVTANAAQIREHCAANPHIVQCDTVLGSYGMMVFFESLISEELQRHIKQFLYQFKDAIAEHCKLEVVSIYKYRQAQP